MLASRFATIPFAKFAESFALFAVKSSLPQGRKGNRAKAAKKFLLTLTVDGCSRTVRALAIVPLN